MMKTVRDHAEVIARQVAAGVDKATAVSQANGWDTSVDGRGLGR
jgi:hypothetical protein